MEINTNTHKHTLSALPDKCPHCHKSIAPSPLFGHKEPNRLEALLLCPNSSCKKTFIAYYSVDNNTYYGRYLNRTSQGTLIGRLFSEKINEISPQFVTIYNQAYSAEQQNLSEICGVGYRKALEFLIKDYTILSNPEKKDTIEKIFLGKVIEDYVTDTKVKSVSKRAVWLGNDETHYIRKWEGKNLEDLKKLISLTVHWIEMEALTSSFEDDMPE